MRKRRKIGACGYLDTVHTIQNGQTLRSISVIRQAQEILGQEDVHAMDYSSWRKNPLAVLWKYLCLFAKSQVVLVFPDERAVLFMIPLGYILSKVFRTRLYYVVIGGWLPVFLPKHPIVKRALKHIDGLFVQTERLKQDLNKCGIANVNILDNFRIIQERRQAPIESQRDTFRMFYLSRIEEQKGVREMIEVVERLYSEKSRKIVLDVYGPVDAAFENTFRKMKEEFPEYIRYCGVLSSDEINSHIVEYDIQLFPTKYLTEGFPGSILDSFYAGVPVLAAQWNSGGEVVRDGVDGILFGFGDYSDMYEKLCELIDDRELLERLKSGCRERGEQYSAETVIRNFLLQIEP